VKEQVLKNLSAVLDAAGSSIDNVVKVNIFLTNMADFAAVNAVYAKVFHKDPKPVSIISACLALD
jgi:2-iminobutanoate/2-iminopropanoate deaminase